MTGLDDEDIRFIEQHLPHPHNCLERYHEAIDQRLIEHKDLCTLVIKEVETALRAFKEDQPTQRFLYRVDSSNQTKSPHRIIQKICKEKDDHDLPIHTWETFTTTMKDIVRFRVVVNFLGDLDKVVAAIKECSPIRSFFNVSENSTIHDPLKGRRSGERSVKLILEEKGNGIHIEIQIITMFQEAWDKKDHPLVYEKIRIGEEAPPQLKALSLITSELLYTADKYFEDFRKDEEES
ncbi:MAG: RelA/SpoT domain-containing protein [Deltaproteobacteria bacterium]|nr:RelA/SpoT domain-containing protein [Deltaproteobacteria bacterium]